MNRLVAVGCISAMAAASLHGGAAADVINESAGVVYIKSEHGAHVFMLGPGSTYRGEQDGIAANGDVIKSSDRIDLVVRADGRVGILQQNPITLAVENIRAGRLNRAPDDGWQPLFDKAEMQRGDHAGPAR
jgi:hypothetical protein